MTMALLVKYLFMFSRLDYKENTARNQQVCCLFEGWPSLMAIQKQYPLVVLKHLKSQDLARYFMAVYWKSDLGWAAG